MHTYTTYAYALRIQYGLYGPIEATAPQSHNTSLYALRCPYVRSYVRNAGRGQLSSE